MAYNAVAEKPIVSTPVVKEKTVEELKEEATEAIVKEEEDDDYCASSESLLTEYGKEVAFDVNSYRIRSRMHRALANIVTTMQRCEGTNFTIVAHTDSDGDVAYNNRLAKKRAEAVKAYLISRGIDADRLTTLAYGEYMASDENSTADKAANRRISFKINRTSF